MDRSEFVECMNCRCLALRKKAQGLSRIYDKRLRGSGLTVNQFSMLTVLILAGPLPVSALADQLGIDRTTMTRNLNVGERDGLVRTSQGEDRRTRLVAVTPRGYELARKALPAWRKAQAAAGST
jgi:DNA-binding MarR family transcriptional regulator